MPSLVFCLSEPDENFLSSLTLPGAMPCDEDFFNNTRGTYGLSAASTLSSGSFYLYNWTASGLFLRREPSGNRIDSLRLVQNTGASGQSAAQLIAKKMLRGSGRNRRGHQPAEHLLLGYHLEPALQLQFRVWLYPVGGRRWPRWPAPPPVPRTPGCSHRSRGSSRTD